MNGTGGPLSGEESKEAEYRKKADEFRRLRIAAAERDIKEKAGNFTDGRLSLPYIREPGKMSAGDSLRLTLDIIRRREGAAHGGHRDRLRTSAHTDGELGGFSDVEILEALLAFGVPRKDTNPMAHALLSRFGTLLDVLRADISELKATPGVTAAAANVISAVNELCERDGKRDVFMPSVTDVAAHFSALFAKKRAPGPLVALLDGNFGLISTAVYRGGEEELKDLIGGACRSDAGHIVLAFDGRIFPEARGLFELISELAPALDTVGIDLLESMFFIEFGYYTIHTFEYGITFEFVPYKDYAASPELVAALFKTPEQAR